MRGRLIRPYTDAHHSAPTTRVLASDPSFCVVTPGLRGAAGETGHDGESRGRKGGVTDRAASPLATSRGHRYA
jgi:hypothetical protein